MSRLDAGTNRSAVSTSSKLIQPLISTEAFSTLTRITLPQGSQRESVSSNALPSRTAGWFRYRQVLLTSVPLIAADFLALIACYLTATAAADWILRVPPYPGVWNNLLALCICHILLGGFVGLFPASGMNPVRELRNQVSSIGACFVLLITLNGLLGRVTTNELVTIIFAFPATVLVAPISRFCARRIFAGFSWWGEKVIIVGSGEQGRHVFEFLKRQPQRGLKPLGVVDENANEYWMSDRGEQLEFLGSTSELVSVCRTNDCHWVIAAVADKTDDEVLRIIAQGSLVPNLVVLNSNMMMPTLWVESFDAAGLSGIHVRDRMLFPFQRVFKRLIDIIFAIVLLAATAPLFLALICWARSVNKGRTFYCHQRIGRNGKPFGVWKFTTMVPDAPAVLKEYLAENPAAQREWETFHKLKDDPRVIPGYGHFLRRTSLDELPQLLNVLTGEMSLVGPRPVYTVDEIKMYGELYPLYLRVRPGLTGLWQVSGRNNTSFADKVWLDTYYSVNWSLWLDYFILLRTVRTVLLREGSC